MEPASIRYKNPGAMWGGNAISKKWGEQGNVALNDGTGQGNHIAVFPTYVHGICAQIELWRTPRYKNKRFADAIAVWSGGNSVESYIAFVTKRVPGMTRDTVMDDAFWRGSMCVPFLKAQAWHEAGKPYPAPDADWIEAQRRVFGGIKAAPPPPDVPKPKPKQPETKPAIKSKTIWAQVGTVLASIGGFLTDWRVAAVLVIAALAVFVILERKGKIDISGWFK